MNFSVRFGWTARRDTVRVTCLSLAAPAVYVAEHLPIEEVQSAPGC